MKTKYFDLYCAETDKGDNNGFSVFVKAVSKEDAIAKAKADGSLDDLTDEEIRNIDVTEIDAKEYRRATGNGRKDKEKE